MGEQKTILLVEDNEKIMAANQRTLAAAGYCVKMAASLAEARAYLAEIEPDAIVLDIMLPDGSGLDFLSEARQMSTAPILLLTALGSKDSRLAGLRAGADDYIAKPYDLDELLERVAAFIRRKKILEARTQQKLVRGALTLDIVAQRALWAQEDMLLTQKEYALLLLLVQQEGNMVSLDTLYETVWLAPLGDNAGALWKHISNLKRKVERYTDAIVIKASRGKGYKLSILARNVEM